MAIADLVKTTLGPKGMVRPLVMLHSGVGQRWQSSGCYVFSLKLKFTCLPYLCSGQDPSVNWQRAECHCYKRRGYHFEVSSYRQPCRKGPCWYPFVWIYCLMCFLLWWWFSLYGDDFLIWLHMLLVSSHVIWLVGCMNGLPNQKKT
jgi:hypothetical protein